MKRKKKLHDGKGRKTATVKELADYFYKVTCLLLD